MASSVATERDLLSGAPNWWLQELKNTVMRSDPTIKVRHTIPTIVKDEATGVVIPCGAQLTRNKNLYRYEIPGAGVTEFPAQLVDGFRTLLRKHIAIVSAGTKSFVAVYSDAGFPFEVVCCAEGKEQWRTQISGLERSQALGRPWHFVELVVIDDELRVFAADSHGVFACGVEAYEKNGKVQWKSLTQRPVQK